MSPRKTLGILLCLFIIPVLNCSMAWARNPDRSAWVTNLSQVAEPEGLTRDDTFLNLSVSGTTIHSVWRATGGPSESYRSSIFYRRSKNNGVAWEAPVSLYQASDQNEINGLTEGNGPILCASGAHVHVLLARHVPGQPFEILYLHSGNSGATFDPARILFRGNDAWSIEYPRLACQGTNVSIGFTHYYGPPQQVVTLNSTDNGVTFAQAIASSPDNSIAVWDIKRNGRFLYLLYQERNDWGGFMNIAVSMDNGQTFTNHRLSTPGADGHHHAYRAQDEYYQPHLALSGSTVYALWAQNDLGKEPGWENADGRAVYMAKSINYGKTFGHPLKVSDGVEGKQITPGGLETVAAKGNHLYVMFPTLDGHVLLRSSNDKGATLSTAMDISQGIGGWWSQLALDPRDGTGSTLHALTYMSYSVTRDGGKTFSTPLQSFPYDLAWERPKLAIGAYSTVLAGGIGKFNDPLCGGGCDWDVMLRRLTPAPAPVGTGMGLTLKTIHETFAGRYDNMQVAHGPSLDFKGAMTLEMWVKPLGLGETTGTTSQEIPLLFKDAELSISHVSYWQPAYALSTVDYYGKRQLRVEIATTTGHRYTLAGDPTKPRSLLPYRTWSHLAFSYDANLPADNLKLFRNGVLIAKGNASGEIAAGFGNVFVGRYGHLIVDEVRFWSRALTQQEIRAGMNVPLTGNESGLEAYYPLEKTTKDLTGHGNDGLRMYRELFSPGKM